MSAFVTTSLNVSTNSKNITVNDGVDFSQIKQSSIIFIESQHPVIVDAGSSPVDGTSTLTLRTEWPNPSVTNGKAIILVGISALVSAIEKANNTGTLLANYTQAQAELFTTDTENYQIQISSTQTVTVPTYLHLANQTQALINNINTAVDTSVQEKVAEMQYSKLDNPLVHLFKKNNLVDTLQGDLSHTRDGGATYTDRYGIVKYAVIDEPRQEKDGWLIEGVSTNYLLNSQDIEGAGWASLGSSGRATLISSDNLAPDNSLTAVLLEDINTGEALSARQVVTVSANTVKTSSVYVKQHSSDTCGLRCSFTGGGDVVFQGVDFSFVTKEFSGTVSGVTLSSSELLNGWFRLSMSITATTENTIVDFRFYPSSVVDITATGQSFIWGCQVETLPFVTSYIPTADAAATRAADIVTFETEGNIPNAQSEWAIFMSAKIFSASGSRPLYKLANSLDSGNSRDGWDTYIDTTQDRLRTRFEVEDFGSGSGVAWTNGIQFTSAWSMNTNRIRTFYVNSELGEFSVSDQSSVTDLYTDVTVQSSIMPEGLYGHISDFRIYDFALSQSQVKFLAGV